MASFALVAVFALGAIAAASAFAEEEHPTLLSEILLDGNTAPAGTPASLNGTLLLEVAGLGLDVLCKAVLNGLVDGVESLFLVEKILNLEGAEIGSGLTGTALLCESDAGCETSMEPEAWTRTTEETGKLPWDFEYVLAWLAVAVLYSYVAVAEGPIGYEFRCLVAGLSTVSECKTETGDRTIFEVINTASGIEAVGATEPAMGCILGAKTGLIEFQLGNLLSSTNGTLTVSSEAG